MKTCTYPECDKLTEGNTDYCGTHNRELRKSSQAKAKVKKPVNKVSDKQHTRIAEYVVVRDNYLRLNPWCEMHGKPCRAIEVHHAKGKTGDLLTNTKFFMGVCRDAHLWIHANPNEAIRDGYSFSRLSNEPTI